MAPSQKRAGQEGIKFNQRRGIVFHETEKAEREKEVNEEDVGRQSTLNNVTGRSTHIYTLRRALIHTDRDNDSRA